jgi:deoxyribonuclease-1
MVTVLTLIGVWLKAINANMERVLLRLMNQFVVPSRLNNVKGDVARVMFYMEDTYGFKLSDQDRKLFSVWSKQDAPDAWEIERNKRIAKVQDKENRFISEYVGGKSVAAQSTPVQSAPVTNTPSSPKSTSKSGFSCDVKKTCGQMKTCAEAKFQLKTCANHSIDGDGDGKPCASLCK